MQNKRFERHTLRTVFARAAGGSAGGGGFAWKATIAMAGVLFIGGCPKPQTEMPPPPKERSRVSIVRERPGDVRVDGVGPIRGFANGRDCTFMHCLELVLDAVGRKIGYDELMGISGMAFRIQFRTDRWDVGNPDPLVGESCLEALFSGVGWDYETKIVKRDDYAEVDSLYRTVAKSIDSGMPVLAANIIAPEDWGIIVGYRGARTWLCRSYNGGAETTDKPATGWPTATVFLTNRKVRPDPRKVHLDSLRRGADLFERKGTGPAALGARALEAWRDNLRSPKDRTYIHANFWSYVNLIDARGAAVRYLRSIAKEFGAKEMYVGMAAEYFDGETRLLLEGLKNVPSEEKFPNSMPPAEMRSRQSETLKQAQTLEEKAADALRKCL